MDVLRSEFFIFRLLILALKTRKVTKAAQVVSSLAMPTHCGLYTSTCGACGICLAEPFGMLELLDNYAFVEESISVEVVPQLGEGPWLKPD